MFSASKFIKDLINLGIHLSVSNSKLKVKGDKESLSDDLLTQIRSNKDALISYLEDYQNQSNNLISADRIEQECFDRSTPQPLSFAQQRLWFIDQIEGQSTQYNIPLALKVSGIIDPEIAGHAFRQIIQRHEVLRTVFVSQESEPAQKVLQDFEFTLHTEDFSGLNERQQKDIVDRFISENVNHHFDLGNDLMLRAGFIKLSEQYGLLLFNLHHIAADGWSMNILVKEFMAEYYAAQNNLTSSLSPLLIQYSDYARWQRKNLLGNVLAHQLKYWEKQLNSLPLLHGLPLNKSRSEKPNSAGTSLVFSLTDKTVVGKLQTLVKDQRVSLFMLLHSAFSLLLSKHSNESDIVVGTPVANRMQAELQPLIGLFVNTLILRTNCAGNPVFLDYLKQVKDVNLEAQANQDIPFEFLVEKINPLRSESYSPLFQVLFSMNTNEKSDLELNGIQLSSLENEQSTVKYELALSAAESETGLEFSFEYRLDLFDESFIKTLAEHYLSLLTAIAEQPYSKVSQLPILSPKEVIFLTREINKTNIEYPPEQPLHILFEEQVENTPNAVALISDDIEVSFAELNRRANQLAHYLGANGVGRETLVGVCLERTPDLAVTILAIFKVGGAYVALDPDYPQARLQYMLEDTQLKLIITHAYLTSVLEFAAESLLVLDAPDFKAVLLAQVTENPQIPEAGDSGNLAYVIYTSGSTGKPKGVMGEHGAILNRIRWMWRNYPMQKNDVMCSKTALGFLDSIWELFGGLLQGLPTVLVKYETVKDIPVFIAKLIQQNVTRLVVVPSLLEAMIREGQAFRDCLSKLTHITVSGEKLSAELSKRFLSANSHCRLLNLYGCSEVAADVTYSEVTLENCELGLIGRPIDNMQCYILDENMQLCPLGTKGMLYTSGPGVARGYLNNREQTALRFVANPFDAASEYLLYKTGDRAYYTPSQELIYVGRDDDQIKIRGFRIEPGEIEQQLLTHASVHSAIVTKKEFAPGEAYLVAYVIPVAMTELLTTQTLKEFLHECLPDYMVPNMFVVLENFPKTPSGKIDKLSLPLPERGSSQEEYRAPESHEEKTLTQIWAELLNLDVGSISVTANFFELGGHSLLATRLVSLVREALGVEIPMRVLFEKPTIREFVTVLSQFSDDVVMPPIVAVSRDTSLSLSFSQQRLWFIDRLENSSQYHIQASFELHGELVKSAFDAAVATIVQRHEVLRSGIEEQDDQPHVVIHEQVALPITHVDLRHLSGGYQEQEIQRLAALDNQTLFDLSRPPLLRLHLIQCDEQRHVVLSNMHHIASDGWSMGVLVKELNMLYAAYCQGEANPLPPLAVQYADYAHWQREWLQGEVLTQQQGYWKQQLEGAPQLHSLPLDKPRPEQQQYQGKVLTRKLSQAQTGELQSLCQAQDVTLFMFMQTAFAVLLSRLSGETDIVIGSPSSGRVHKDLEGLIGFFINALPLRSDVSGNPAFDELLQVNRRMILDAFEHQHIPFDMLVEELKPQRSLAYAPLAQIYLTIQNNANQDLSLEQLDLQGRGVEVDVVRYDLEFDVFVANEQLVIDWKYNTALFEESTLARMADSFEQMLSGIMQDTRTPVQSLPLLTDTQREQLLHEWNDTGVDIDNVSFVQAFEKQVVNEPDAIAVIADAAQLTYGELNSRANRLAHYLIEQGVSNDIPVALCLSRTPQMLIGLMAILKAGGAYVPIDASYPEERVRYLLADAKVSLVISETAIGGSLPLEGQALMCLDDSGLLERLQQQPESNPGIVVSSGDMAYVIYTSGTTGQPKGVMVTHEGLMNYVSHVGSKYLPQIQGGVVSLPLVFDATVTTLLSPLCHGCFVELLGEGDDALERLEDYLLDDEERLLFKLTPAHLDALWASGRIESNEDIAHVIVIGGEQLTVSTMEKWQGCFPNAVFINEYGPTETVVGCSVFTVTGEGLQGENVPIGKPIQNTQLYCLDEQMQLLPSGVVGELYIGGAGVARGYLGRESLTAERFVDDPFGGKRLYRTGDRVRWRHDGQLAFLGRNDNQVKVRGYRIEPGEIEARLLQHEAVEHAVVIERHQRLQTYLIPSKAQAYPIHALSRMDNDSRWDSVLRKSLPNGMVVGCLNSGETDFTYDEIFIEQTYLKHGVTLKPDATIFDVGANTGMFTLFSSQLCPQAKLFSFEPIPDVFQVLSFNAALYDVDVELCNFGLSDKAQEVTFTFYPYNSLISGRYGDLAEDLSDVKVYLHNQYKEDLAAGRLSSDEFDELLAERLQSVDVPCQLKTLSEVIEAHDVKVIDLLKLDVEKSEMDALKGLKDEHWPLVQQMIVEVHDIENRLEELQVLLADKGFSTHLGQETLLEGSPLYVIYAIRHGYPQGSVVYGEENVTTTKYPWSDKSLLATGLRDSLAQSLPSYMVPDVYLFMDKYPLTVNGKVDTRALPDIQTKKEQHIKRSKPRNEVEQQLCEIWQEVLNIPQVGIEDNFFALGGDSIISIQVVSRAKRQGLHFTVRQLFDHQCIAKLAETIGHGSEVEAIQTAVTGDLALLPVQRAFFGWQLPVENHYNQSVLLTTPEGFDAEALRAIVQSLYERHDALRLRFESKNLKGLHEAFSTEMLEASMEVHDFSDVSLESREALLLQTGNEAQGSFDISKGVLFKAVYMDIGEQGGRLLLLAHHLVIDGVSWRIVLSDLEAGWEQYRLGEEITLPEKSSSLQQWGEALQEYAMSHQVQAQKAYWSERLSLEVARLPGSGEGASGTSGSGFSLDEESTIQLLGECNEAYRTRINELLLCGLLMAYQQWSGNHNLRLLMEGHGREELFEHLDVNDTVGWFTSLYPLILSNEGELSDDSRAVGELIKQVKEQYRGVPDKGIGYGLY